MALRPLPEKELPSLERLVRWCPICNEPHYCKADPTAKHYWYCPKCQARIEVEPA